MSERKITCSHCGRHNRVPEGILVEASCGRCESALTWYTWIAPAIRRGTLGRVAQYAGGAALLAVLLGPPLVDWLDSEPFALNDRPQGQGDLSALSAQIAGTAPAPEEDSLSQ